MRHIFSIIAICISLIVNGQDGTLIGTKPTAIEPSAELEIYSTDKGILLPRVASVASIATPATGLLVYDIAANSYSYFDGAGWILLPIARFSELRDKDGNTRITTEKTPDVDNIQIDLAGVPSSVIDTAGINMSAGIPYQIAGDRVASSSATSVYLGKNAGGAIPTSASNVMLGTSAGAGVTAGTHDVALGYGTGMTADFSNSVLLGKSSGNKSTGTDNVFLGNESGNSNTSGVSNVFIGNLSGATNTTGSSNVFVGNNAGTGHSTGNGNVVIGSGVLLADGATDSLKIGAIISAKDKVTFNNAYNFPNTVGVDGQTLILDADNKSLKWTDAGVSTVDQTVIGSAAGLYTFDIGSKGGDIVRMQRQMFIVPLVATANASISQLMTWKKIASAEDTQMALYDENFNLLSVTVAVLVPATPKVAFVSQALVTPQDVVKGKTYYVGVRSHGDNTDYAGSTNVTGTYYFMDNSGCNPSDTQGISTDEDFPPQFITGTPGFPVDFVRCTYSNQLPWVRAF